MHPCTFSTHAASQWRRNSSLGPRSNGSDAEAVPLSSASVVLPYSVQQLHWHELFFSFLERCVYHFEGLGAELPAVSPIRIAFDASLGSQGWQLVSLCDEYQSDGSSCGVWLQAARDAWLRYVASTDHGSKIFAAFLRRTFEAAGVHSLSSLRGRELGAAQRGNVRRTSWGSALPCAVG